MPRLILKCPHFKNRKPAHLENLVTYIATRENVDKIDDSRKYKLDQLAKKSTYVQYIGQRPGVEKQGTHGLFTMEGIPVILSQVAQEVANHPGTVWTPIISLRREDAARLGYDRGEAWRELLRGQAGEIADCFKIPREQFRWFAAFHNESYHPHVHMVCYSADAKKGFLTPEGIEQFKSGIAKQIFRQDLLQIYSEQTELRNRMTEESEAEIHRLCKELQTTECTNPQVLELIEQLSKRLSKSSGKKVYGYLKPDMKQLVDRIVDALATQPQLAALYELWWQKRLEVLRTYSDKKYAKPPLSEQKEFKRIKNMVIEQVLTVSMHDKVEGHLEDALTERDDLLHPDVMTVPEDYKATHWLAVATKQGHAYAQVFPDHLDSFGESSILSCATRLLRHLSRIFEEDAFPKVNHTLQQIDRKRRQKLREKKRAQGHAYDDHELQIGH